MGLVFEEPVDAACDVALEAADGFSFGFAFCEGVGHVFLGGLVMGEADHGDAPEGVVGLAVAAAVEAAALLSS